MIATDSFEVVVPVAASIRQRIAAYIATLPNLAEGQGRDDVAFTAAAFLVRDMAMSDAAALPWLEFWDAGNNPPKGRDRLAKIITNARTYGTRAIGCGLRDTPDRPTTPAIMTAGTLAGTDAAVEPGEDATSAGAEGTWDAPRDSSAKEIILWHFRRTLQPTFRRGEAIYSASRSREVRRTEACFGADSTLIAALSSASDVPRLADGTRNRAAVPRLFATWCRTAWVDLIGDLPEEQDGPEIVESAQDEFRRQVAAALHRMVSLGRYYEEDGETRIEHRSLIDWAVAFAKPGRWAQIRSYCIWTRRQDAGVQVAITAALFGQVAAGHLASMGQRKFASMARQYGVATYGECRAGGRSLELSPEFIAELTAGHDDDAGHESSPPARQNDDP